MIILLGVATMIACLAVQMAAMFVILIYFTRADRRPITLRPLRAISWRIMVVMFVLMIGNIIQMGVWGVVYATAGHFADYEEALYFSGITLTSLGYGDITLPKGARLISAMEAADGLMMFGVTSGILMAAIGECLRELRGILPRAAGRSGL